MTFTDAIDNQLARLRLSYAKTPLPRFFTWWGGELAGLLPTRLRALLTQRPDELLIGMQQHELGLWRLSGEQGVELGRVALDAPIEEQKQQYASLRGQIDDPGLRVFYCVASQRCLVRELSLPVAAEDRLRQVLAFEMDRQTPFKADQVYFDYRIAERNVATKTLKVQLNVMPRVQLDAELAKLAATGVALDGVDCWHDEAGGARAGLNLLPLDRRIKQKNQRLRLNLALASAAILLLLFAMWLSLTNRQASLDAMTAEVQKAQGDAKQTSVLMKKLEDTTDAANFLARMKHDTTTATEILADLTQRLPDDAFLERLSLDEKGKVDVQGQSTNAAKLIDGLQKSEVLIDAAFTGTIQTDPRTKKERFNLSMQLRKHPDAEPHKAGKTPGDKAAKPAGVDNASAS